MSPAPEPKLFELIFNAWEAILGTQAAPLVAAARRSAAVGHEVAVLRLKLEACEANLKQQTARDYKIADLGMELLRERGGATTRGLFRLMQEMLIIIYKDKLSDTDEKDWRGIWTVILTEGTSLRDELAEKCRWDDGQQVENLLKISRIFSRHREIRA